jgi:hypothetical protein
MRWLTVATLQDQGHAMVVQYKKDSMNLQSLRHFVMPLAVLLPGAFLVLLSLGIVPAVSFTEETIDLYVHPDNVEVQAQYIFKNPWSFPMEQHFCLPFTVDSQHPLPREPYLTLSKTDEPIPVLYRLGSYRFALNFRPHETVSVTLYYKQESGNQKACYILTSTRAWLKPLSYGLYRLHNQGVVNVSSNYPLAKISSAVFSFERANFMPEYDWQINWSKGK